MADHFTTEESTFITPDKHSLYTKTWRPTSQPLKARLIFIHGFSDHINFQGPLFPILAQNGIVTYSFDQRGWGRSVHTPAEKGKSGPTTQVLQDINDFVVQALAISDARPEERDLPVFMLGHSMGGQETLHFAATGPKETLSRVRGFMLEAPFVALHPSSRPWRITVVLGRLAQKLLPNMHMVTKLDPKSVARDPKVAEEIEADPLCHNTGTLEGLAGMLDRAATLEDGTVTVPEGQGEGGKTRLWFGMGTVDLICDYQAVKDLYERSLVADKTFESYEGWYHKLHLEPGEDKVKFCNDVVRWILEKAGEGPAGDKAKL
ncbi:alpha/beta-hydrolase [Teratosphaeria nubilosa]|uniref:Alpha/beta-hydrolase n=1 Tax=Teratosphaeria nubilosa TaxID=161662 RepID=A0A6G1LBG6_9PEZI|nr:alpha/beta-hydrolase [Teratosphaeria nubilosa]